jgi:outer membrane receptor protein involved in Fe transport
LLATTAVVSLAGPAFAQDRPAAGGATQVDELIVTANKRSEALHDVPMAMSAISQDRIERTGATGFADYLTQVPGVNLNAAAQGAGTLTIRGINAGGVASTVGVYVDETPFGSSSALVNASVLAADINPFDMTRVEVLKGPQGTLYGAGALGGVIKYVTNEPSLAGYSSKVEAGLQSVAHGDIGWEFNGMVNAPLGDKAAVRFTGYYQDRPGFIDDPNNGKDDINASKVYGGRLSVLLEPVDKVSIRLTATTQNIRNDATSDMDIFRPTGASDFRPLFGDLTYTDAIPDGRLPRIKVDYRVYNATVNWDLGFAKLLSSTSYSNLDFLQTFDYSALINLGDFLSNKVTQDKFTQEARLASQGEGPLEWQAGVYYTRETGSLHQVLAKPAGTPVDLDQLLPSVYREVALFGDVTYHFTPTFDVTGGLRWAQDKQTGGQFGQSFGTRFNLSNKSTEDATTFSLSPRWRPTENTTVYARIASGYLAGGPNVIDVIASPAGTPTNFAPEKLINYEVGLKQYLFDGKLAVDIAAYHIDWTQIQLLAVVNSVALTANGGKAVSDGIEWSVTLAPVKGLTLGWDGAWSDAHLTQDTPAVVGAKKGDQLPRAPKFSNTFSADYEWDIAGGYTAFVGGTVQYVDEQGGGFVTGLAFRQFVLPSYTVGSLRAGVKTDRFGIQAYVNNIGDEEGFMSVGRNLSKTGGSGPPLNQGYQASVITPRTIGVRLSASF